MKKFQQKGFTLVELLVVIAIIAILGVVAIAAINPAAKINAAKDAQSLANVQQLSKAFEACLADRMTAGVTQAVATDNCCGSAAVGACTSSTSVGLGLYNYGFTSGWPTGVAVNRNAAGGTAICISQQRGTDTNYNKYIVGGGTVNTAAAGACANGV